MLLDIDGYLADLEELRACRPLWRAGFRRRLPRHRAPRRQRDVARQALTGADNGVDIISGTFGETLGGGMDQFVAADQPYVNPPPSSGRGRVCSPMRSRHRLAAGALKALESESASGGRCALLEEPCAPGSAKEIEEADVAVEASRGR